jgi:hypothetical protein
MATTEEKLRVFANWCSHYKEPHYYTGTLESALLNCQVETINKIGDMLDEILNSDTLDLDEEIKNIKSNYL